VTAEVFLSKVTAAAAGPEHSSRAESLLRTALALEEELGIVDFEAGTCELLGSLLNRDGGTEEGDRLLVRALELYDLLADRRAEALRARLGGPIELR
jgi:hypothetical protein